MDLNWMQSILYGLLSGLTDIFPVSAQAHKVLYLKFYGMKNSSNTLELLIHLGIFVALYYSSQTQLIRMSRARALSRIPKKKRKRPLDTRSLMDWKMLLTMSAPVILGLFLYQYTAAIRTNLVYIALFLFLNGIVLYIPQFFPTSNRDARTLSRIEGLLMGLGGIFSVLPGISAIGAVTSIGSLCGVDKKYALNMALILNMVIAAGLVALDVLAILEAGVGVLSITILLRYLMSALAAFAGTLFAVKLMRHLSENAGHAMFGMYCWGLALFTFILNLIA